MGRKYTQPRILVGLTFLLGLFFAIIGLASQVSAKSTAAAPAACWTVRWCVSAAPDADASSNILSAVAAVSPTDAWAIGESQATGQGGRLISEHWNGKSWSLVPVPSKGTGANAFIALTTISSNDVWAVGAYYDGPNQFTLTEHWNGRSWRIIQSPSASPIGGSSLDGVVAVSSNNIWAVGGYNTGGAYIDKTYILHWDGDSWQAVDSPNAPGFNFLYQVTAVSSNDVWAVGFSDTSQGVDRKPLCMHWNGQVWSIVSMPVVPEATDTVINGIGFRQKDDGWAVGTYFKDGTYKNLTTHWNGREWTVTNVPNYSKQYNELQSVSVTKKGDAWAVGAYYVDNIGAQTDGSSFRPQLAPSSSSPGMRTEILHWTGSKWEKVSSPNPGTGALLTDVTSVGGTLWAVGSYISRGANRTLVARFAPLGR